MSKQDNGQLATLQRPTTDSAEDWQAYWEQLGQPWRTEPEIDPERQKYLAKRRHRLFKGKKWVFPLNGVSLSRADVEWLLATHKDEYGAIDLDDRVQPMRRGLDLYGVDLRGVNLSRLPLARAYFFNAHLEGVLLCDAYLENANFVNAHMEKANLRGAHLQDAFLADAHLEGADLVCRELTFPIVILTRKAT